MQIIEDDNGVVCSENEDGHLSLSPLEAETLCKNVRLAFHYVRRSGEFCSNTDPALEEEDFVQEAAIGLARAILKYDPNKEVKLSTYAKWWMMSSLQRMNTHPASSVKATGEHRKLLGSYYRFKKRLGRYPTRREIETEFSNSGRLLAILRVLEAFKGGGARPIWNSCNEDGGAQLESVIGPIGPNSVNTDWEWKAFRPNKTDQRLLRKELRREVLKVLRKELNPKEFDIIFLRFGFNRDGETMSLKEIGEKYGVSRERIRQLQERALRKLCENPLLRQLFQDYFSSS